MSTDGGQFVFDQAGAARVVRAVKQVEAHVPGWGDFGHPGSKLDCPPRLAKATATIAKGASGQIQFYGQGSDTQGSETKTSEDTTKFYARNGDISSGDWLIVGIVNGNWELLTASECPAQDAIVQVTIFGNPTGGTFTLGFGINAVGATITFTFNDAASQVATKLLAHPQINTAANVNVTGGPFPNATVQIEFQGALKNTDILPPTADFSLLTGGFGVGIISALAQKGSG